MVRIWISLFGLVLAACVNTEYTPYRAEYGEGLPRVTDIAVLAQRGDVEALVAAGGFPIGTMTGYGNAYASHSAVESRVRESAAERGATHILFASSWVSTSYTPVSATTKCTGNTCNTTTTGGEEISKPRAGYVLVRVPLERWVELHLALQPKPLGPATQSAAPTFAFGAAATKKTSVPDPAPGPQ
jgi:hypothetical protein